MKIRNILPEFKIAGQPDPKDAADYKEKNENSATDSKQS